jgi:peptide/nickel transport system substrate-binding protein
VANNNPGFWDVHYGGSLHTTLVPSSPRFNQLVEYNPVNPTEIIGDLARTWEVSDDGSVYTFHLHDATWTDGKPVTAEDIVFSLDRITLPDALRARTGALKRFYEYQTAEVIDEKTVRVPLKFLAATFLLNLASDYMKMYPKHVAENLSQDEMNCCPEKMIGSGPWMFKGWKRDASYSFERNPNYFKKGPPFFDGLEVFLILDNARRISALQTGQVFGTFQPVTGGNRPEDMVKLEQDTNGQVRAIIAENVSRQDLFLNITKPPFDDPRVRCAVYLGLDRREGVQRAVSGFGNPGSVFAPGTVEDMDELSQTLAYQEDRAAALTEAKRLLAEAGYPDGFKATINT